jgi:hypothetical protein
VIHTEPNNIIAIATETGLTSGQNGIYRALLASTYEALQSLQIAIAIVRSQKSAA